MSLINRVKVEEISHVAAVVRDLDKALKNYREIFGIEDWIIEHFAPPFHRETYIREKPVDYTMKVAIARISNMYYELIEPLEGPSIYKEFLETRGEGLHHIGRVRGSLEEVNRELEILKRQGIKILQRGIFYNSRYFYLDTEPLIGVIYEIVYKPSR